MRTYILAESPEAAISVSNIVSASGATPIISNKRARSYREMLDEIAAQQDAYDLYFMVTADPVNASIDANKRHGMRAYFCDSQRYVAASRDAGTNVVVLDIRTVSRPEYSSIISGFAGSSSMPGKAASAVSGIQKIIPFRQAQQPQQQSQQQPSQQSQKAQKRMIIEAKQKGKPKGGDEDYAPQQPKGPSPRPKSGLFGKLKDSLGIE